MHGLHVKVDHLAEELRTKKEEEKQELKKKFRTAELAAVAAVRKFDEMKGIMWEV